MQPGLPQATTSAPATSVVPPHQIEGPDRDRKGMDVILLSVTSEMSSHDASVMIIVQVVRLRLEEAVAVMNTVEVVTEVLIVITMVEDVREAHMDEVTTAAQALAAAVRTMKETS